MLNSRVYLDWNASSPIEENVKIAMSKAMDHFGNPSSIHNEGRKAKSIIESARRTIATALGANNADIIFVSSATEGCAYLMANRALDASDIEHDAVFAWRKNKLDVSKDGGIMIKDPQNSCMQAANSETGLLQDLQKNIAVCDATQMIGKLPISFDWSGVDAMIISAHKFGGPKGVGAVITKKDLEILPNIRGGGQEFNKRAGTENIIGIAGFAKAVELAQQRLDDGLHKDIEDLRNYLEDEICDFAYDAIIVNKNKKRLPNTTCVSIPYWLNNIQVIMMDLEGFSISAGSACSSGKVTKSRTLSAMGMSPIECQSAIRISIGHRTTKKEIDRFLYSYKTAYKKNKAKAA